MKKSNDNLSLGTKIYVDVKNKFDTSSLNNIIFKIILCMFQAGKIKHLIPVDFQAVHPGSPAIDLLYFIYSGTDEEFRRLHLNQLLDHYYSTLSYFLRRIDIDPEQAYSRKDFDEEYKNMLGHGLCTAIMLLPIVLASNENAPNLGKGLLSLGQMKSDDNFRKRFMPILNDFVKWGVL